MLLFLIVCFAATEVVIGTSQVATAEVLPDDLIGPLLQDPGQFHHSPLPANLRVVLRISPNRQLELKLHQSQSFLGSNFTQIYYEKGKARHFHYRSGHHHHCIYQGIATDSNGVAVGSVAASLCHHTFEALIQLHSESVVVVWEKGKEPAIQFDPNVESFNLPLPKSTKRLHCGGESSSDLIVGSTASKNGIRVKRGATQDPSYYRRYVDSTVYTVELALVFDFAVYRKYQKNLEMIFDRAKAIANVINTLYRPLNIRFALVAVEVWSEGDKMTINTDPDVTLTNFLYYRKQRLNRVVPGQDNAQLITGINFSEGVVGKALKGTMCSSEYSGGVNMDHSVSAVSVGTTISHEIGHNFGMEHDKENCECPQSRCIMSPSIGSFAPPKFWSSCSVEYLQYSLRHGSAYCLTNPPTTPLPYGSCGDGFVQAGEDCDCGSPESCDNACCDARTCRLVGGAQCANGLCCDLSTCTVKQATTLCRGGATECDLPEFCDGKRESCPDDVHVQNGISCGDGAAHCYDGECRSHDDQCRLLWGDSSTSKMSPRICYNLNEKGDIHGNCGKRPDNDTYYAPCLPSDALCGQLQCVHQNEKTEFGDKSVVITGHVFIPIGVNSFAICRHAIVDLGGAQRPNPGLVPNGANCGDKRMCLNQKCVDVEEVLQVLPCADGCSGNGVCNSRGHCHCHPGFSGEKCRDSGTGGSVDSGPVSFSGSRFSVGAGVLVFVFVILPLIAVITTLIYRNRQRLGFLGDCKCWDNLGNPSYDRKKPRFIPVTTEIRPTVPSNKKVVRDPVEMAKSQWDEPEVVVAVPHKYASRNGNQRPVVSAPVINDNRVLLVSHVSPAKTSTSVIGTSHQQSLDTQHNEPVSLLTSIFEALEGGAKSAQQVPPVAVSHAPVAPVSKPNLTSSKSVRSALPSRPPRPPIVAVELAKKDVAQRVVSPDEKSTAKPAPQATDTVSSTVDPAKKLVNRSVSSVSSRSKDYVKRPAILPPPVPPHKPKLLASSPVQMGEDKGNEDGDDDGLFDEESPDPVSPVVNACESYYDVVSPVGSSRVDEESIYSDIEEFRLKPGVKHNKKLPQLPSHKSPPPVPHQKPIGTATIFNGPQRPAPAAPTVRRENNDRRQL